MYDRDTEIQIEKEIREIPPESLIGKSRYSYTGRGRRDVTVRGDVKFGAYDP